MTRPGYTTTAPRGTFPIVKEFRYVAYVYVTSQRYKNRHCIDKLCYEFFTQLDFDVKHLNS